MQNSYNLSDRKIVIATKHHKENVIAPLLEKHFNLHCFVPSEFDTDVLGTFTGEKKRELDPVEAARRKCLMAMDLTNADLGIANEGSFYPHPIMCFFPCDEEIVVFIDRKNKLEFIVKDISLKTNFRAEKIISISQLKEFCKSVKFPSHKLIIKNEEDHDSKIFKGIDDWADLKNIFTDFKKSYDQAYIETDMRAMNNPTRMTAIKRATQKLIKKIKSVCPQCKTPGFDITHVKQGLPCQLCMNPTKSTLSFVFSCQKCLFEKEKFYPHNKKMEDPQFCDSCNP